jgi:hypothetical protein
MARPTPAVARAAGAPPAASVPAGTAKMELRNSTVSPLPEAAPVAASPERTGKRSNEAFNKIAASSRPTEVPRGAAAVRSGTVRLQFGSVRSAGAARLEWAQIRQKNSDLLGSVSASTVRADLGDKGVYYRIETGPVGDAAANRLCGALKERKVGCVIVR